MSVYAFQVNVIFDIPNGSHLGPIFTTSLVINIVIGDPYQTTVIYLVCMYVFIQAIVETEESN